MISFIQSTIQRADWCSAQAIHQLSALGDLLNSLFLHLENGVNNYTSLIGLLWGLNELLLIKHSEKYSVNVKNSYHSDGESGGYYY